MTAVSPSQLWTSPFWLKEATSWIHDVLDQRGVTVTGRIKQARLRAWSTVLHVPTNVGDVYFKASAPVLAHEAAVTDALYRWRPDCIPQVLGMEAGQGWLLMADGGQIIRELFNNGFDIDSWKEILPFYAGLQIDLAGKVEPLLALGARDRRLARLPALYQDLIAGTDWLLIDQPSGITSAEYDQLVDSTSHVAEMCHRLAAYAIPESLHHNDLHDGNIFLKDGHYLFFDWGDSSIAHPFFSLRTVFVSIEHRFGLEENDPLFDELAAVYVNSWAAFDSEENLWAAYRLAQRLWALSSAVKYKTIFSKIELGQTIFPAAIPGLLREFLQANSQAVALDQEKNDNESYGTGTRPRRRGNHIP